MKNNRTDFRFDDISFRSWAKKSSIGERIKWLLEERGYTQKEVADKVGITQAAISNWITGDSRKPNADSLLKLATEISASPYWVMHGSGAPFDEKKSDQYNSLPEEIGEHRLIKAFRAMSVDSKIAFITIAEALANKKTSS